MNVRRIFIYNLFLILLQGTVFCQHIHAKEYYQLIKKYTAQDGMASDSPLKMIKDVRGFYWMATAQGLARFDGNRFMNFYFDELDNNSISNNWITDILNDNEGMIWIGTRDGVCKIDPYSLTISRSVIRNQPKVKSIFFVHDIVSSIAGELFVATGDGVYHISKLDGSLSKYLIDDLNNPVNNANINSIELDKDGHIYLCYGSRFLIIDDHAICAIYDLGKDEVCNRMLWADNFLFVDLNSNINYRYDLFSAAITKDHFLSSQYCFNGIAYNRLNHTLVYTNSNGLFGYDFNNITSSQLIQWNGKVQYSDKSGIIFVYLEKDQFWISTSTGLYLWEKRGSGIETYEFMDQLKKGRRNELMIISEMNNKGDCYISLIDSGLLKYNIHSKKVLPLSHSLQKLYKQHMFVEALISLTDSTLLLVSEETGLIYLNINTGDATPFHEIYGGKILLGVNTVLMEGDSILWYGLKDGLYKYNLRENKYTKIIYKIENELLSQYSNKIDQIVRDINGIIWCISDQRLLLSYVGRVLPRDDSMTIYFNQANSKQTTKLILNFKHIETRYDDLIWVSSNDGLIYWKSTAEDISPKYIGKEQGFASDFTRDIAISDTGILWVSTFNGLVKYNYVENLTTKFITDDGLFGNASWRVYIFNNKVFLPYSGAFSVLNPKELRIDDGNGQFGISNMQVNGNIKKMNKSNYLGNEILKLNYKEDQVTFGISRQVSNESDGMFKYKLLPLNTDWKVSNISEINYHNLLPGNYEFEVSPGSLVNSLKFDITAPFWQTLWFKLSILLIILGLIRYYIYGREKVIRDQYQLRQKISSDLHDDIGSTLTSINILSNVYDAMADKSPEDAKKLVHSISVQSREMQQSMSDIVWAVRPDNERIQDLIGRMREYTGDTLEKLNIKVEYNLELMHEKQLLPMELRKDFLLLFKETINNVARHAQATSVSINLKQDENNLLLTISDDGTWKTLSQSTGLGITSMEARAIKMNGSFLILPSTNGTKVKLSIPIP